MTLARGRAVYRSLVNYQHVLLSSSSSSVPITIPQCRAWTLKNDLAHYQSCKPRPTPAWIRWSSSSGQWKQRQFKDHYRREAQVHGLKSRAAFKLLEMDAKYKLFKRGQTVVDLGYAPGSWSQVAVERTKPTGRIIGIDLIPAQPPKGVAAIQGDFLSPAVQALARQYLEEQRLRDYREGRQQDHKQRAATITAATEEEEGEGEEGSSVSADEELLGGGDQVEERRSYIDQEKMASQDIDDAEAAFDGVGEDAGGGRMVDIVLSDMMMNTSGINWRDHTGSMDLCTAALQFASDTLRPGGHFVCKYYQGSEDKLLEDKLRKMFVKVFREKPEASRSDSKEAYFVALRRKPNAVLSLDS